MSFREVVSPASLTERTNGVLTPGCFRGAADFPTETQAVFAPTQDDDPAARPRKYEDAQCLVISGPRACGYFERNRAGLTPEGHLELRHRREDRYWTAGIALVSAIIGGAIAAVPVIMTR